MTNNNQQFLIQHEEFNKNFIFPSINNINTQQVITLYENFKKILPKNIRLILHKLYFDNLINSQLLFFFPSQFL